MSLDEAHTLLVDCSTPYLIGCETALLASFGGKVRPHVHVHDLQVSHVLLRIRPWALYAGAWARGHGRGRTRLRARGEQRRDARELTQRARQL